MPKPKPRRLGDPNNQPARGHRNVPTEALRTKRLAKTSPAGQADRAVSYDPAAVRAAINAQTCPICGNGPYKVLAVHTNKAHGIDRRELREMAGLTSNDSICAPEYAQGARERAVRSELHKIGNEVQRSRGRKPQEWSKSGLAKQTAAITAWNQRRS